MEDGIREVDKKVIHVNDEPSFSNHVAERVVHEPLEDSREVGKAKEHYCRFKQPFISDESGFPLVAIFDSHIVIPLANIKLGEYLGVMWFVNEVGDKGKRLGITNGVFIDISVVLT